MHLPGSIAFRLRTVSYSSRELCGGCSAPNYNDHSLGAIAERSGLTIIGQHSSLGDAIVTREVFLKRISLLDEKGIVTLDQAQHEAQKTLYGTTDILV